MSPNNNRPNPRDNQTNADPVMPDQGGRMSSSDPTTTPAICEQTLQIRAYQRYEARGRGDGRALEDWLAAECELHAAVIVGRSL